MPQTFYPAVSSILNVDYLPDPVKDIIVKVGDKLFYKTYYVEKGQTSALFNPDDEYYNDLVQIIKEVGGVVEDAVELVLAPPPLSQLFQMKELLTQKVNVQKAQ